MVENVLLTLYQLYFELLSEGFISSMCAKEDNDIIRYTQWKCSFVKSQRVAEVQAIATTKISFQAKILIQWKLRWQF